MKRFHNREESATSTDIPTPFQQRTTPRLDARDARYKEACNVEAK
jgi:hypothetical protein